ncbi:MAG: polyphosphate:AMP phosphotransferase [Pseudomonadaceae bacterium]|nr:MAG: polyphosphate:AMP phosphotransferase [Pseudomonadaceae bacterium]
MSEQSLDKSSYKKRSKALQESLLDAQFELQKRRGGPVLVLISGNDFAGKAELIYTFYGWLDTRRLNTRAFNLPAGIERRMPRLWRYWRTLPPAGELGFYLGSWYHQPLMRFSRGQISEARFQSEMQEIVRFETLLTREGVSIIKLWLHLTGPDAINKPSADTFKQTVAMREWGDFSAADYDQVRDAAQRMEELTSTAAAPWIRVQSSDENYRDIRVAEIILDTLQQRLQADNEKPQSPPPDWPSASRQVLQELDYTAQLSKEDYETQLESWQARLRKLVQHPAFRRHSLLLVFEGSDAAGKGGTIRRITECLDPRHLRVHGTAAPNAEEATQPYLLRFWKRIPAPGNVVIFDRSHYGRVLVERVEGFCPPERWQQAYQEINDFEQQLHTSGTLVLKFWLAITEDEQLQRFKAREKSSVKRYKLTDEDWRNREKWPAYEQAVNDMVAHTSSKHAPWHLISSEDKRHARVETLKIVCEQLEQRLERSKK